MINTVSIHTFYREVIHVVFIEFLDKEPAQRKNHAGSLNVNDTLFLLDFFRVKGYNKTVILSGYFSPARKMLLQMLLKKFLAIFEFWNRHKQTHINDLQFFDKTNLLFC